MAAQISVWAPSLSGWVESAQHDLDLPSIVLTTMQLDPEAELGAGATDLALMQEMFIPMSDLESVPIGVEVVPGDRFPLADLRIESPAAGILHASGETSWFAARTYPDDWPYVADPWPQTLELAGVVSAPPLDPGIMERFYCDIEVLFDGDILLTFAQTAKSIPFDLLDEGFVRYDSASGTWGVPQLHVELPSGEVYAFKHPSKAVFGQSGCLAVDGLVEDDLLFLGSNLGVVYEGLRSPPTPYPGRAIIGLKQTNTYQDSVSSTLLPQFLAGVDGNIQGLAAWTPELIAVQRDRQPFRDYSGADGVQLVAIRGGEAELVGETYGEYPDAVTLSGAAGTPVRHEYNSACEAFAVFTSLREPDSTINDCAEIGVVTFWSCSV
jgi:hypothetical protein